MLNESSDTSFAQAKKQAKLKKWLPFVIAAIVLIVAAIIILVVWLNKKGQYFSVSEIRNLFNPTSITTPTAQTPIAQTPPPVSTPVTPFPPITPLPTPPVVTPTPVADPEPVQVTPIPPHVSTQTHRYDALGFELQISSAWQAQNLSGSSVAFTNSQNQQIIIESYPQGNTNLETLNQQLTGSSSVSGVSYTSFKNLQAISFYTSGQQAMALITNGRIYYIFGVNFLDQSAISFL